MNKRKVISLALLLLFVVFNTLQGLCLFLYSPCINAIVKTNPTSKHFVSQSVDKNNFSILSFFIDNELEEEQEQEESKEDSNNKEDNKKWDNSEDYILNHHAINVLHASSQSFNHYKNVHFLQNVYIKIEKPPTL